RPQSLDHSEIYEMWLEGRKDREIAEALGCTRQYVSTIRSKKGWVRRKIATKCKAPGCDKDYGPKSGEVGAHGYCKTCYNLGWGRKPYRKLEEMYVDLKQKYRDLEKEYIDLELEYDFLKNRPYATTKHRVGNKSKRQNQCQHCKGWGHNSRTCTNDFNEFYVPPAEITEDEREMLWAERLDRKYPGLLEQVGTLPDSQIAEQYVLSRERIRQIRNRLGIKRSQGRPQGISDDMVSLLGTETDAYLAEKWGVSTPCVQKWRQDRGIPSFRASNRQKKDDLIGSVHHLLGKVPDSEIVAMLGHGTTNQQVYEYRKRHGIQGKRQGTRWNPLDRSEITRLFKAGFSDKEIAQHIKAHPGTVSQIRTGELGLYRK
ncbi:MAG: hypothetical protein VXZ72_03155, partial [Chlamydiota bacterium]|nr:hypothetical protein [Chlamydiota bacterium]